MQDLWERALQDLKGSCLRRTSRPGLPRLLVDRIDEATLTLRVPNKFYADWLQTHYLDLVRDALRNHGAPQQCAWTSVCSEQSRTRVNSRPSEVPAAMAARGRGRAPCPVAFPP